MLKSSKLFFVFAAYVGDGLDEQDQNLADDTKDELTL